MDSSEQMDERLHTMIIAVKAAGDYILQSDERQHTEKTNKKDFATVADIKAQNKIFAMLGAAFPGAIALSEELSEEEREPLKDPNFSGFVIDPIDGTYNYKRDMRESAISIGLVENGESIMGVVYDPYKDELFYAEKGKGAFRNGERTSVNLDYNGLNGASVGTSNSYDRAGQRRNLLREVAILDGAGDGDVWNHMHGSGVLIMTNIACGRFDAYHHNGLKPWDNAAAFLIVREAGGVVQTLTGEEAPFTSPTVLMGTPGAVSDLRTIFSNLPEDQKYLLT
jgi:myo-inositol-1(or 4)-monophosphatase